MSEREFVWVLRVTMLAIGVITTAVAVTVKSVVVLLNLCVDLPYSIIFPQQLCALYVPVTNSYGSFVGFWLALFLRLSGGEPFLKLEPLIKYPWYDEESGIQCFPYKTMATCAHLMTIYGVSVLAMKLVTRSKRFRSFDLKTFKVFVEKVKTHDNGHVDVRLDNVTEKCENLISC